MGIVDDEVKLEFIVDNKIEIIRYYIPFKDIDIENEITCPKDMVSKYNIWQLNTRTETGRNGSKFKIIRKDEDYSEYNIYNDKIEFRKRKTGIVLETTKRWQHERGIKYDLIVQMKALTEEDKKCFKFIIGNKSINLWKLYNCQDILRCDELLGYHIGINRDNLFITKEIKNIE